MKKLNIKQQLIVFLGLLALYIAIKDKDLFFLMSTFLAVISAVGADSIINFLKAKKFLITESSVISGLIIGFVVASDSPYWKIVLVSFLAIGSKHLIRFRGKHVFNPAAFGIFSAILLLGIYTQWRGTYLWYILLPSGVYFLNKIRKIEVVLSYFITLILIYSAQGLIQRTSLMNLFGYFSYFFVFIMLIEPKTSPISFYGKIIFGTGVGVLSFILTQAGAKLDVELLSLLVFNLSTPFLNGASRAKARGF